MLQNTTSAGVDLSSQRDVLVVAYNSGNELAQGRALVVRALADNAAFRQSQYNQAFVLTEYFAYLQREPEPDGYGFWVNILNTGDPGYDRGMVCSFITSMEYQVRFSPVATHSNAECGR